MPKYNLLSPSTRTIILDNFESDVAFLQQVLLIYGQSYRYDLLIVPASFVLFDWGFFCAPAVLGGGGGGEVPFYEGFTGNEGDVVKINYLDWSVSA